LAKITITIEDIGNNQVRVVATPNFETMMKMDISGERLTSAHGYALLALNKIREKSKDESLMNKILIPGIGRA
jgi:hypothetical protein